MMLERLSAMNKDSRSGSLTSDLSIKAVNQSSDDDQLITALIKRILSKVRIDSYILWCKLIY